MDELKQLFDLITGKTIYSYQQELLQEQAPKIIINKSRQIGLTSFYAYYALIKAFEGKKVLIVSPSERQSLNFMSYVNTHLASLAEVINIVNDIKLSSAAYLELSNGGSIRSLPNNPNTVRGFTADLVVLDEFALVENAEEIWQAVYPTTSRGGRIVIISTPYGEANLYAEFWREADKYGFKKHLINYKQCPDLTSEKVAELRKTMDELSWRQEYENEFLGTKESYFPMDVINKAVNDELTTWQYPEQIEGKLVFGVDLGRTSDKTSIVGINEKGEVKYVKNLERQSFKEQKEFLIKLIPKASLMAIDQTGLGMQLAEELQQEGIEVVRRITITNELKLDGFIELRRRIEQKQITLPNDFELKRSLNLIERKSTGNTITFDAPRTESTGHSDEAFALMLAVYTLLKHGEQGAPKAIEISRPLHKAREGLVRAIERRRRR